MIFIIRTVERLEGISEDCVVQHPCSKLQQVAHYLDLLFFQYFQGQLLWTVCSVATFFVMQPRVLLTYAAGVCVCSSSSSSCCPPGLPGPALEGFISICSASMVYWFPLPSSPDCPIPSEQQQHCLLYQPLCSFISSCRSCTLSQH